MHSSRLYTLLLLVAVIVAVAQASRLDNSRINQRAVIRRQDTGSTAGGTTGDDTADDAGSSPTDETTADPTDDADDEPAATPTDDANGGQQTTESAAQESTSAPPPAEESSSTSAPPPAEETTSSAPASQETTSEAAPTTSSTSASSSAQEEATTASEAASRSSSNPPESSSTQAEENESQTTASAVVSTKVEVVTKTNDDGSKQTMTSTSRTTSTPGLNADTSGDDDGGMSDSTRNTIIGVVVGIGGAIVLGAVALVAWRIWGRRKRAEENDALMDYDHGRGFGQTSVAEKTEPPSTAGGSTAPSRSPFQQTLENYHQPANVNASSNF